MYRWLNELHKLSNELLRIQIEIVANYILCAFSEPHVWAVQYLQFSISPDICCWGTIVDGHFLLTWIGIQLCGIQHRERQIRCGVDRAKPLYQYLYRKRSHYDTHEWRMCQSRQVLLFLDSRMLTLWTDQDDATTPVEGDVVRQWRQEEVASTSW